MPVSGYGDLLALAVRLREMGTEGQGLRRELYKSISDAADPLAARLRSFEHLAPYMPDRYAVDLAADIDVTTEKRFSSQPYVRINARGRHHQRKVIRLNAGLINHPVYPKYGAPRKTWHWRPVWPAGQTGGMRPGFFTDPVVESGPETREKIMAALAETARKIRG